MQASGATVEDIQSHYDVGNEFYRLWLDRSLTYSCALWDEKDVDQSLDDAQLSKIDWHLESSNSGSARKFLDVGCGWGSTLARAGSLYDLDLAVGLTLSDAQSRYIATLNLPKTDIRLESWADHQPDNSYDSIVSIGAFEHFAKPSNTSAEKVLIYRSFFEKCRSWMSTEGRLSLQTIAYGRTHEVDPAVYDLWRKVFPQSEMPKLEEIVDAVRDVFEIVILRNDRLDYARTCEKWLRNLRKSRMETTALIGQPKVEEFERYLRYSMFGFLAGNLQLLRIALRPI